MNVHEKLSLLVRYPVTKDELKDHTAPASETVGHLESRVLAAFSLTEGVNEHGELIEYALLHNDKVLQNPDKTVGEIAGHHAELELFVRRERHFFLYLSEHKTTKIFSPIGSATGLQIKEMIKAVFPDFDLSHTLILEGHGHDHDEEIKDDQSVSLEVDAKHRVKEFISKPPTNFGQC